MQRSRYFYGGMAIAAAVLLMALLLTLVGCECPESVQVQGISHFVGPIDVTGAGTASLPALYFAGDTDTGIYQPSANNWGIAAAGVQVLNVSAGGVTLSDGDAVVADDLRVTAQTAITVTNGVAFAPTGTYQRIQAAGTVTPTITVGTAGDLLVLINISAQTINIADTGIQMLSTAWAGGQYDVLVLWCDGTNWLEVARSNN